MYHSPPYLKIQYIVCKNYPSSPPPGQMLDYITEEQNSTACTSDLDLYPDRCGIGIVSLQTLQRNLTFTVHIIYGYITYIILYYHTHVAFVSNGFDPISSRFAQRRRTYKHAYSRRRQSLLSFDCATDRCWPTFIFHINCTI